MTETKRLQIKYFDTRIVELIHSYVSERWRLDGEPIPAFSTADEGDLDAFIKIPQSPYFGVEQYPTLESKAAIIFYTLNKKHLFLNGNKRLSVACLLVFILINDMTLDVEASELTEKALWLAKTSHEHDFDEIKQQLEQWLKDHIVPISK